LLKCFVSQVIHTIYWLSRKSSELGIPLSYYFDINNPSNHSNRSFSSLNNSSLIASQNKKSSHLPSGSYYSSSSSSSSAASYSSSFSNSSLNQYSTSSTSSAYSSLASQVSLPNHNINNNNNSSLSIIVSNTKTTLPKAFNSINNPATITNNGSINTSSSSSLLKKKHNQNGLAENTKNSNEINSKKELVATHCKKMNTNFTNKAETHLVIDAKCADTRQTSSQHRFDETRSNESTSTNNSPISLANSNHSPKSPNQHLTTTTSSSHVTSQPIPTRYIDRRVSTSVIQSDPYKFNVNYSEAGQKLAKKAQEQLKTVEKCKELGLNATGASGTTSQSGSTSTSRRNSELLMNENGSLVSDDWQNVSLSNFILLNHFRLSAKLPCLFQISFHRFGYSLVLLNFTKKLEKLDSKKISKIISINDFVN